MAKIDRAIANQAVFIPRPVYERVMRDVGMAACCWDNLEGAGMFNHEQAQEIAFQLCLFIMGERHEAGLNNQ